MARPMRAYDRMPAAETRAFSESPVYQAYTILLIGFTIAPIVAGADKFASILTDWTRYLAPVFPALIGVSAATFMRAVGAIEIIAGIVVAAKPSIGGYVVAAWLVGIIVNLLVLHGFYDIALRDLGLALGALALARLATRIGR